MDGLNHKAEPTVEDKSGSLVETIAYCSGMLGATSFKNAGVVSLKVELHTNRAWLQSSSGDTLLEAPTLYHLAKRVHDLAFTVSKLQKR